MLHIGLRRNLCLCLLGLAIAAGTNVRAANQSERLTSLPSGKHVAILAIGPAVSGSGKTKAIMLRYHAQTPLSNREQLEMEADDLWDLFKIDADQSGLTTAVIAAEQAVSGAAGGGKQQVTFVLAKDAAGNWTCRNSKIVGIGTPAKAAYRQAFKLFTQARYQDALACYNKSIQLDPSYVQSYVDRAGLYISLQQWERSLADSDTAISLMPANAAPYCNRGIVNLKLGKCKAAVDDFTSAIRLNPDLNLSYANRGIAYLRLGQFDEAIADLRKSIARQTQVGESYYNLGLVFDKLAEINKQKATQLGYHPTDSKVAQRVLPKQASR